jgi:MFS transporter, YNFM family, putative membrane transport protein
MKVIGVLSLGALVVLAQLYLTIPLMPDIEHRYAVSPSAAAWVGSGFSLAYAFGNLIFGTISDRYDRRFVMVFGVVGGAVLAGVTGLSTGFAMLVAVRAAQGFVAAAFAPVALAYAVEVLAPARRALGLAFISCGFLLAGIFGQAFALWGNAALGWRGVLALPGVPLLLLGRWLLALPAPPRHDSASSIGRTIVGLVSLLRRPQVLVGWVCALTLLLAFVGMYGGLSAAAATRYGISGPGPLLLLRLAGIPGILMCLFAGRLIRAVGPHRTGVLAFLLGAGGLVVEALAGPLWLLLVGSAGFVAGIALAIPCAVAVVGAASGAARGAGIAGYGFLIGVGGAVAPLLVAVVPGFGPLCLLLAAALLVSAAAMVFGYLNAARHRPGGGPLQPPSPGASRVRPGSLGLPR